MPQRIDKALMMLSRIIAPVTRKGAGCFLGGLHGEAFRDDLADLGRIEKNESAAFYMGQRAAGLLLTQPSETWAALGIRPNGLQQFFSG